MKAPEMQSQQQTKHAGSVCLLLCTLAKRFVAYVVSLPQACHICQAEVLKHVAHADMCYDGDVTGLPCPETSDCPALALNKPCYAGGECVCAHYLPCTNLNSPSSSSLSV